MTLKERLKKIGNGIKTFWNEHRETIIVIGGAAAATGACVYAYHKLSEFEQPDILIVPEVETEENIYEYEKPKWKEEYNDDWGFLETAAENMEHVNGYAYIIAGPNSEFNPSDDTIELYMYDPDSGIYLQKPDES